MNQLRNARWMRSRGHQVVLFVRNSSKLKSEAEKEGLPVAVIKKHRKYYDLFKATALRRLIKKYGVTHLIVRDPKDIGICALTKSLLAKNLTLAYFMEMQIGISKRDVLHTIRFKLIDYWVCPLPWLAEQVKKRTKFPVERIKIIPSGLDLTPFLIPVSKHEACEKLGISGTKTWIGLIGRFDEQKGQHILLKAFSRIKENHKDLNLIFLGEKTKDEADEYFHHLLDLIDELNLSERVFFKPFRKDVTTFFAAIDIFVMATRAETFGMVTIEAMAAGKKIIGSNAGGTPEILGKGKYGQLFESGNADDLASQITKALSDISFDAEKVKEEALKYDANLVCEQVEKVLFN